MFLVNCFDPQALTSLTEKFTGKHDPKRCFDPQALTSLTINPFFTGSFTVRFRSTGSYEPDQAGFELKLGNQTGVDPQALTSLTGHVHLLRGHDHSFDPQALTSLTRY